MSSDKKKEKNQKSNKFILAFFASIIGCVVGIIAVKYLINYGYKSVGPIGLFCGLFCIPFIRKGSNLFGLWCLLLALFVSVLIEFMWFSDGKTTLGVFLQNMNNLSFKSIASILFGIAVAFYFGRGKKSE